MCDSEHDPFDEIITLCLQSANDSTPECRTKRSRRIKELLGGAKCRWQTDDDNDTQKYVDRVVDDYFGLDGDDVSERLRNAFLNWAFSEPFAAQKQRALERKFDEIAGVGLLSDSGGYGMSNPTTKQDAVIAQCDDW